MSDVHVVVNSWAGIQRVAAQPKPAEYFAGRDGYRPAFLGDAAVVELPKFSDKISPDDIAWLADGTWELKYRHYSAAQCISRKMPFFSACNIDGSSTKNVPRHDTWNYDGRIPKEYQMLSQAYGPQQEGKFSRGHMTRRQDPNWGEFAEAQQANIDTFVATNVCPQWQPFNDGLWGDLEDYILGNADGDDKRVSVFTGPFFDTSTERFEVRIPHDFWKVVAFVSERTRELSAIAYRMSQSKYLLTGVAADLADFDLAQIPLELVELRSGLRFASLAGRDVFAGATLETLQPISRPPDTKLPG
jgi:endonuclease G